MYIGLHKSSVFDPHYLGSGKILKEAILKNGKENFITEIIEWCSSLQELQEKEKYWIKKLNACNSKEYYNISEGGTGDLERALETKEKIKKAFTGENNPAKRVDVREKIRQSKLGDKNPMKREEVRLKVKKALEGKIKKGNEHPAALAVKNLTTGEIFETVKAAAQHYNLKDSKGIIISKCARKNLNKEGNWSNACGCIWVYVNPEKIKTYKKNKNKKIKGPNRVGVINLTTGDVFDSITDAVKYFNINYNSIPNIVQCCRGYKKRALGYEWAYMDPQRKNINYDNRGILYHNKKILDVTTGKIYNSYLEASRDTGICDTGISACCRGNNKTAGGHVWKFYEENLET